jgi:PAS domain S-box-containing protein
VTGNSVLVVDDNDSGRYLKVRALRSAAFDVYEAATAQAALNHLEKDTVQVVILDVKLPDMHGFELCRVIKNRYPTISILQTSATFTSAEDRIAGLDIGADAYLVEPMEEPELIAIVRALLRVRQAEAARRSTEMLFAQFAQASPDLMWIYGIDESRFEYVSPSVVAFLGHPPEDVMRDPNLWLSKVIDADRPAVMAMITNTRQDEPIEYRIIRDGIEIWIRDKPFQLPSDTRNRVRVAGLARDVTQAKRADQQRDLMIGELNHRVKNTLALVQSLATQTGHTAVSLEEFEKAFTTRLHALAAAHDLLTDTNWEGTTLHHVIKTAVAPFTAREGITTHIDIAGPTVWINSNTAITLALAFHELVTNAAKYGALSIDTGRVKISWMATPVVNPTEVDLSWRESGGPAVKPPARTGFGSMLLERVLAYEADGKVDLSFPTSGVEFNFKLPLSEKVRLIGSGGNPSLSARNE